MSNVLYSNDVAETSVHARTGGDANYSRQYTRDFVDHWDELIDWQKRAEGEGSFFVDLLHKSGARRVIDVSTGSGFHAVQLRKAGFYVVACDGSPTMVERADANFKKHGVSIPIRQSDWLELDSRVLGTFDAVVCLGSSLCHVFDEQTRHEVLKRFRSLLKPGGLLIVDQRNFQAIRAGKFKSSGRYYYCGTSAKVGLGEVSDEVCEFVYTFSDRTTFSLRVYPILPAQLRSEIELAGFNQHRSYGDFKPIYDVMSSDFIVHSAFVS
ncbi:class I SAM-dependent methyltransferase [Pseudomonas sp. NA-150]|uniref:class I SAM-dependent methyltransferase n=1 Tax=Pseudomonas sp. NA-150 TaxID=3367525 RepID=UPI0037CB058A